MIKGKRNAKYVTNVSKYVASEFKLTTTGLKNNSHVCKVIQTMNIPLREQTKHDRNNAQSCQRIKIFASNFTATRFELDVLNK